MKKLILFFFLAFKATGLFAQTTILEGIVVDGITNEPLPTVTIRIEGIDKTYSTDFEGGFKITDLKPGLYNVSFDMIGYKSATKFEVALKASRPTNLTIELSPSTQQLEEVTVSAQTQFSRDVQSPVSVQSIGINEIQRNPGGNQDISRVIQSLPGVASTVAFRNDLIIRGGGPNENRFYLDGIEIPSINHFATQGSSGGPVGMINVNFIRDVDFFTSAFPAQRGNALSSIMEINLKDGRTDRLGGIAQIGASDIGLTLEGPLGKNTTFLASARRSYLQFLFGALGLPFLPTYNDFQFKVKHKFDNKNQLTILGLGAIDQSMLNLEANETEEQRYILNYLPEYNQWNYSIGAKYTHFNNNGYTNVILSRFMFNNESYKYRNNDKTQEQLLNYQSREVENKLRIERNFKSNKWESMLGLNLEQLKYSTNTLDKTVPFGELNYSSEFQAVKWGLFGTYTRRMLNEHLVTTIGFRTDALDFNSSMRNPLNQFSPRLAVSYYLNENWTIDANVGIYYQLPPSTTIGYRDTLGNLVNTDVKYIRSTHYVLGSSYFLPWNAKISLEGFIKQYSQYPFLLKDSISLANLGGDFGVVGNGPATSISQGRAYGAELTYQQKLYNGFYGIAAFTWVRSFFDKANGEEAPASWDNRFLASITMGKKFGKNWEIGLQYQYLGGAPYTPYDVAASALISNWDNIGRGIPDYTQLNSQRLSGFNRLNIRIDKKWFFKNTSLDLYFDVQNALKQTVEGQPFIDVVRDANGNPVVDPSNPNSYQITRLENKSGTLLPSIGIILEF